MSCPSCRVYTTEIARLRTIIAHQDARILRMHQTHAADIERITQSNADTYTTIRHHLNDTLHLFNGGHP